jgi:hypothetical protein
MPTDTSAGNPSEGKTPQPEEGEDLTFAAHDLGRDRPTPAPRYDEGAAFEQTPRPADDALPPPPAPQPAPVPAPPRGHDGFVIRELVDAVTAPVDALVVSDTPPPAPSPIKPRAGFRIHSSPEVPSTGHSESPLPWTVRHPVPAGTADTAETAESHASRKGWTSRDSGQVGRSAQETARRLREDAVHVSWKAAWVAVTTADHRLFKRRDA